ncbi:hypothetical protein N7457_001554 [Penicillium paradoxum]|uniref:uncharacterized protein n=1 Tax=Penicillium paradoxum TaxID=176176 RepID=UPI002547FAA7|nr:uncharacterized protein N7457_001554 [Penicillium paradoxum]KAJ5794955.1 hypothetical protein N7457_001554 [Penicillium paradoxum]
MSDDDEYYEFEEDYMYEDLVPDMVTTNKPLPIQDDLAASSHYEAALYEDPGIDVEDYFSDWDYYSDDYHDDDATAEKSAERRKRTAMAARAKRLAEPSLQTAPTSAIAPVKSSVVPDISSFQGVVWKTPALDRDQDVAILYEPDTGDKVALLENWREVFKSAQPALDKSRLKKRRVEESRIADSALVDNDISAGDSADDESEGSDEMSDVPSLDTSGVDTGDISNTKTHPKPEIVRSLRLASPPQVVIPLKRGLKRKTTVRQDEPDEDAAPPRSKKVETRKGGVRGTKQPSAPPVRRSTRQKK